MLGFVVLVEDHLDHDAQLELARKVAELDGVKALHALMYVKRETYEPLGPRLLNVTTGQVALLPKGLEFVAR